MSKYRHQKAVLTFLRTCCMQRAVSSIKSLQQRGKPTERVISARRCCYLGLHSKTLFPFLTPTKARGKRHFNESRIFLWERWASEKFQRSLPPLANISLIVRGTCVCCVHKMKGYIISICASFSIWNIINSIRGFQF